MDGCCEPVIFVSDDRPIAKDGLLGTPTNVRYAAGFELPDNDGTLQLELVPGLSADGRNLVQLSITAAGAPMNGDVDSIMEWVDKGRYAVVKCFSDVTSDEVHSNVWERI